MQEHTLDILPLDRAGRFRPLGMLGRGAMGVVYKVHDTETDSEVALKTFAIAGPEDFYRLKAEFRVLSDLVHPNLVELYELVVDDDLTFFTMEYVDGTDFVRSFRDKPLSLRNRLPAVAAQLADGVAALHAAGKLHRDIKPSNVLVAADERVVLLDFGLATAFGQDSQPHYGSGITGTPAYMAPEILLGFPPLARSRLVQRRYAASRDADRRAPVRRGPQALRPAARCATVISAR